MSNVNSVKWSSSQTQVDIATNAVRIIFWRLVYSVILSTTQLEKIWITLMKSVLNALFRCLSAYTQRVARYRDTFCSCATGTFAEYSRESAQHTRLNWLGCKIRVP